MFALTPHEKSSVIRLVDGHIDLSEPKHVGVNKSINVLCIADLIHVLEKWISGHFHIIALQEYTMDVGSHVAPLCVFSLVNHVTLKSPQFDDKVFTIIHNFCWFDCFYNTFCMLLRMCRFLRSEEAG